MATAGCTRGVATQHFGAGATFGPATDDGGDAGEGGLDDGAASSDDGDVGEGTTGAAGSSSAAGTDDGGSSGGGGGSSGSIGDDGATAAASSSDDGGAAQARDLSGWVLVQTDSARELQLPPGTLVPPGGAVIVVRDTTAAAFAAFWAFAWDDTLVFVDGGGDFPTMNGDETYALRDPDDVLVDGPSPPLVAETAWLRIDADASGATLAAWQAVEDPNAEITPASASASGGASGVPYVAQIVDATGNGNYVYEFVEIRVAP